MPPYQGLLLLAERLNSEHEQTRKALAFSAKFIDQKFRDGGRITERDYQEFLSELNKI